MRSFRPYAPLLALLAVAVAFLPAAARAEEPTASAESSEMAASSGFVDDYLSELDRVRQQIESLAAAMPQKTYTWRPSDEVRSVSEVYLHMAFANYMLPSVAGYAPPADLKDQLGVDKLHAWDTATTDKGAVAERLSRSFDHLRSTVAGITDADLEEPVEFFGQEATKRQMLMLALGHLHEHLGQSIAYARMNGVVPPWTAAQQEAQRKAAEESGGD
jgi:uncharacterized damage-inducible protein DinB